MIHRNRLPAPLLIFSEGIYLHKILKTLFVSIKDIYNFCFHLKNARQIFKNILTKEPFPASQQWIHLTWWIWVCYMRFADPSENTIQFHSEKCINNASDNKIVNVLVK